MYLENMKLGSVYVFIIREYMNKPLAVLTNDWNTVFILPDDYLSIYITQV